MFVTRAKSNRKARRRQCPLLPAGRPVDRSAGFYPHQDLDTPLRRIRFTDPKTGKRWVFAIANFALAAITITASYPMTSGSFQLMG